jgi:DNA-binding beta-propeller fold protein YncE/mono/diheme cytochrome c family protein
MKRTSPGIRTCLRQLISFALLPQLALLPAALGESAGNTGYLSPTSLAVDANGKTIFIGSALGERVLVFDLREERVIKEIAVPGEPLGLALSRDGLKLYVTCAKPSSVVAVIDLAQGKVVDLIPAGHTAMAPVLSPDGKTLYVSHRFNNEVAFIDLGLRQITRRVPVPREPVAAALTADGKHLLVANHIHAGRADLDVVAASVTVIDTVAGRVAKEIALVNGSGLLRGIAISPDGKYAAVTHLVSRFHLPTTQIERGWINNNALSLINVATLEPLNTVLLDNIDSGAANPWAVEWSADGQQIVVTHAGTHELTVIEAPALLEKLLEMPAALKPGAKIDYSKASRVAADVPNDLTFLVGLRKRVKLPETDRGPRALALIGSQALVANYFTDTLARFDFKGDRPVVSSIPLGPQVVASAERLGEFYFNDATICFQGWQSCASCHSSDARVDGLNWDNLNDGIGNPKNVKSLLQAHFRSPMMWLGVRSNAFVAVRAGIRNSLFTVQPPEVADAIDAYLMSLEPIPSPHLVNGELSPSAQRGKDLFFSQSVGCADCHKDSYYTDQRAHHVGTRGPFDKPTDRFFTPTLVEIWRTAPYLHDGSATSILEVLTTRNEDNLHGDVRGLSAEEIADLAAFVLSL